MTDFERTKLSEAIRTGDANELRNLLNLDPCSALQRDVDGSTYLHQVVRENTTPDFLTELMPFCDISARDVDGNTALDLLLNKPDASHNRSSRDHDMIEIFKDHIMNIILDTDTDRISGLIQAGWNAWPIRGLDDLDEYKEAWPYVRGMPELKVTKDVLYIR